ncbi:hypothetical protein [Kitasatospora camelliae]|uniref:FXSXX-COOH protein n=1 Tax=Kitasatospora camelliae TaxID=3156397 RepID=A0AAU8K7U5_9ACTN
MHHSSRQAARLLDITETRSLLLAPLRSPPAVLSLDPSAANVL